MATTHEDELLTVAEAAELLKISRATLQRWIKAGRLPAYHVGRKSVRIRRRDLDRLLTPAGAATDRMTGERHPFLTAPRPMTDEEIQRGLAVLEEMRKFTAEQLKRRGGVPYDESWPMIREAREQRSRDLL